MILNAKQVDFGTIKTLVGQSLALHEWDVDNGGKVKAQVKITKRNGLVHSAYLHITIIKPSGQWMYYRETPKGTFKFIAGA